MLSDFAIIYLLSWRAASLGFHKLAIGLLLQGIALEAWLECPTPVCSAFCRWSRVGTDGNHLHFFFNYLMPSRISKATWSRVRHGKGKTKNCIQTLARPFLGHTLNINWEGGAAVSICICSFYLLACGTRRRLMEQVGTEVPNERQSSSLMVLLSSCRLNNDIVSLWRKHCSCIFKLVGCCHCNRIKQILRRRCGVTAESCQYIT